ncbi:MAG TPA: putative metal-dependent hydrolase [Longimicrobiales bacterium]|jgi:hypothetical protein
MDDPRYPIGPFTPKGRPLTESERSAAIDRIEAHPANMRAAVAGLSDEQLDTTYRDEGWTVRQVVHHVVDSHVNAYVRFKKVLTEEHPTVGVYEESLWAELPDARSAPVDGSLAILDALHARWVSVLRALGPDDFARKAHHPEIGDIDVDVLVQIYGWHCPHHEAHITTLRERMGW